MKRRPIQSTPGFQAALASAYATALLAGQVLAVQVLAVQVFAGQVFAGQVFAGPALADTPRERGAYIVNVLAACAGCHTPRAPTGPGPPLSGGNRFGPPEAAVFAANITSDATTGIGRWSDKQIADALRRGVRPDGTRIRPPMPQTAYRAMRDADVAAVISYLRSVPPVVHAVPTPKRDRLPASAGPTPATNAVAGADARRGEPGPAGDENIVSRGRYIATALSHCTECHTAVPLTSPEAARQLDAGGRLFKTAKGSVVAPGIRAEDLARFSDEALAAIVERGVRPDGTKLAGPMPVKSYAGFRKADLDALIAFLRSDQTPSKL